MHKSLFATTASVIAFGLAAASTPVFAQGSSGGAGHADTQSGYSQSNSSASHISQAQIKKFAKTQKDMQPLVKKWQSKINQAQDQQKKQQYQQQMNARIVQAIKKDGLSIQQYNKIARASQKDPQLSQRIQQAMQD